MQAIQTYDSTILGLLDEIAQQPCNVSLQNILADYLDDFGREGEAKLTRLRAELFPLWEAPWEVPERRRICAEINQLILCENVRPVVPTIVDEFGIEFVQVPPGVFKMGSPKEEVGRFDNEAQTTQVVNFPFWMSKYPITQVQYQLVMGNNPSEFKNAPDSPNRPVENVSWDDVAEFTKRLREQTGEFYILPPEACFEYACRAGTPTPYHFGEELRPEWANYSYQGSPRQTTPVGKYPPNAFGLHDMHGNVWKWCLDEFVERVKDSPPPTPAVVEMLQGGEWNDTEFFDT